jgi:hypothetical protein
MRPRRAAEQPETRRAVRQSREKSSLDDLSPSEIPAVAGRFNVRYVGRGNRHGPVCSAISSSHMAHKLQLPHTMGSIAVGQPGNFST